MSVLHNAPSQTAPDPPSCWALSAFIGPNPKLMQVSKSFCINLQGCQSAQCSLILTEGKGSEDLTEPRLLILKAGK